MAERLHAIERKDDVLGGQRIAALELHVVTQLKDEVGTVGPPALGEMRRVAGATLHRQDERVVDIKHQNRIGVVGCLGGIELADSDLVQTQHRVRRCGSAGKCGSSKQGRRDRKLVPFHRSHLCLAIGHIVVAAVPSATFDALLFAWIVTKHVHCANPEYGRRTSRMVPRRMNLCRREMK